MRHRLEIKQLRFTGLEAVSEVDFEMGLNIIHGESNTGKSLILQSIQHVFGKDNSVRFRDIAELKKYNQIHLDISIGEDEYTISRSVLGTSEDILVRKKGESTAEHCRPINSTTKNRTISECILSLLTEGKYKLRKNGNGKLVNFTLNKLMLVSMIDEAKIIHQSQSPFMSGQNITKTEEQSAFKLYIEGKDDSDCIEIEAKQTVKAKLDGSISSLQILRKEVLEEIKSIDEMSEIDEEAENKEKSLAILIDELDEINNQIKEFHIKGRELEKSTIELKTKRLFSEEIVLRFELYRSNLDIDEERLRFVDEGNFIMNQLPDSSCPVCGQSLSELSERDVFYQDYQIEAYKSELLKVRKNSEEVKASINHHREVIKSVNQQLVEISAQLESIQDEIEWLQIEEREPVVETIETLKETIEAVAKLEGKKEFLIKIKENLSGYIEEQSKPTQKSKYTYNLSADMKINYLDILVDNLENWHYQRIVESDLHNDSLDISIDDKLRISNGKGHRAILAAAMVVSLMEYCNNADTLHLGFVILDSPLLSLKERKTGKNNEIISDQIAKLFLSDLAKKTGIQTIILENKEPDKGLTGCNIIEFTNGHKPGRAGLLK